MGLKECLIKSHQLLDENQVAHALIGGMALSAFGVFRATEDIDYLVDGEKWALVREIFLGESLRLCFSSSEVLQFEGSYKVDFLFANRPLSKEMLANSQLGPLGIKYVGAEELIGLKIQAFSNQPHRKLKDLADIQALLDKNPNLDWKKIKNYADLFDQWRELEKLK